MREIKQNGLKAVSGGVNVDYISSRLAYEKMMRDLFARNILKSIGVDPYK